MWVFFKDSFLSIIDPEGAYDGSDGPVGERLLVRARFKGDIERVFPRFKVRETKERDYRFRALVPRETVAKAMSDAVMQNGAKNFKGSTKEKWRHDTYMRVWSVMHAEQLRQVAKPVKSEDFDDEPSFGRNQHYHPGGRR